jgi:hypothetical protein
MKTVNIRTSNYEPQYLNSRQNLDFILFIVITFSLILNTWKEKLINYSVVNNV